LGLRKAAEGASRGYTLVAPEQSTWTYLVDRDGNEAHRWPSAAPPGQSTELMADGTLLRAMEVHVDGAFVGGKGRGGAVEAIAWNGETLWRYEYNGRDRQLHHDVEPMPNGNILMIAWEQVSRARAVAAGRNPDLLSSGELWPDHIIEVEPGTQEIVWEWRVFDHLVQDHDPSKRNFGVPAEHPRKIDLNYTLGGHGGADWNHTNSIAYDAARDEIVLSVRQFSEIWVLDHAVTTAQARGPAGDLRFRWGNPAAYGTGDERDATLFVQHDARWVSSADGDVAFTVFNNGRPRQREFSTVDTVVPALADGEYVIGADGRFAGEQHENMSLGPDGRFFAPNTSGALRLPNGNLLVTDAPAGRIFEVTPAGRVVWDYVNPYFSGDPDRVLRSGAGFRIAPWRLFKAEHYDRSFPGLRCLRSPRACA
jgi:hypothetical protein